MYCTNIESIVLANCKNIDTHSLVNLIQLTSNTLSYLNLEGISVDSTFLEEVITHCPLISKLNLSQTKITQNEVEKFMQKWKK